MSELTRLVRSLPIAVAALVASGQSHGEPDGQLLDPTRPKGWQVPAQGPRDQVKPAVPALRLQGTFSLAGERSAVISGRRVVVGDEISGARVLEINHNKVVLQRDGERIVLASLVPDVKSPAGFGEAWR